MTSLIDQYGSWEGIANHIADGMIRMSSLGFKEKPKLIEWLMKQKDYSPSGYKGGVFADTNLYIHAYQIYKKLRSGDNQQHITLVGGKVGKGKSTLALQLVALVDPEFNMSKVCYIPPHLFRTLAKSKYSEGILIDEGGNFFKSRNSMTKMGKDIAQAFQLVRDLRQFIVICYDEPEKLDKEIITKVDSMFIKVVVASERGDRRYRYYHGYGRKNFELVKKYIIKNKGSVTSQDFTRFKGWNGHNSKEVPLVNDVTEKNYQDEKRKYLRDHMNDLADKYKAEYNYKELDKKEYMPLSEASKLLGYTHTALRNRILRKEMVATKIGKNWLLEKSYVNDILNSNTNVKPELLNGGN